jgi:hypothetical protein
MWDVLRQEVKAAWLEVAASVACWRDAEAAWWTVDPVEAWTVGKVEDVCTGLLSIQSGIGEVGWAISWCCLVCGVIDPFGRMGLRFCIFARWSNSIAKEMRCLIKLCGVQTVDFDRSNNVLKP